MSKRRQRSSGFEKPGDLENIAAFFDLLLQVDMRENPHLYGETEGHSKIRAEDSGEV